MKKILHFIVFFLAISPFTAHSQCTTPTKPATLLLSAIDTAISVYYNAPATVPSGYFAVISTSSTLSTTPVSGTTYTVGASFGGGTVVYNGTTYVFSVGNLNPNTKYYIFIYSRNDGSGPCYSTTTPLTGNVTTAVASARGIPAGYYNTINTQTCADLKTALNAIIKPTTANPAPTYQGIRGSITLTDSRLSDDKSKLIVWDIYSDKPSGTGDPQYTFGDPYQDNGTGGNVEGDKYNREHTFPQAWFGDNVEPMYSDLFIVYPTDKYANGLRANFPYGKVGTATKTLGNGAKLGNNTASPDYTGTVFEPIDDYKGDVARSNLYVITAYQDSMVSWWNKYKATNDAVLNGTSYPSFDTWYLKMLYQWSVLDPVSQKEIDRNNNVYMIQGNRNPYIDHPEYVERLLTCVPTVTPVKLINFAASKNANNVLVNWSANTEVGFKNYEIEKSIDGINFIKVGNVTAQNAANYSFNDDQLTGSNMVYYRLKMIDIDGNFSYSKIVSVKLDNSSLANLVIYPNPATDAVTVKLSQNLKANSTLRITDVVGRVVLRKNILATQNIIPLNVQYLAAGKYFITINNDEELIHQSFIKTK